MSAARTFLVSVVSVALLVPRLAPAEGTLGVLAIAPPPGPGPEIVEAATQLRYALADRMPRVLDAPSLRERMTARAERAPLAEIDRALAAAREARAQGDYEASTKALRKVVAELDVLPQDEETLRRWAEAMMRLAKNEIDLGRSDAARATLDELVRTIPDVKVDRIQYPPSFERQVNEAHARVAALPVRSLSISSSARGARIFVGGREFKVTAVTVPLPAGRYRVSAAQGSQRVTLAPVDLTSDSASVSIDFAFADAFRPASGPGLALAGGDAGRRILDAGAFLRVDRVVAVTIASEGGRSYVSGALYDVQAGKLQREARVYLTQGAIPLGGLSGLADHLATGRAPGATVQVTHPPPPAPPRPPPQQPPPVAAAPAPARPAPERAGPDGQKLAARQIKIAAQLRDAPDGTFMRYVDAGTEVLAADKPVRKFRLVVLPDGQSGYVPARVVEEAAEAEKRLREEARRAEEKRRRDEARRAEEQQRQEQQRRDQEAARALAPAQARTEPAARPGSRSALAGPEPRGPKGEKLVAGRLRTAAELRDGPDGTFMKYVERDVDVWTTPQPTRGFRLVVLTDGLSGYVRAGSVEVVEPASATPAQR